MSGYRLTARGRRVKKATVWTLMLLANFACLIVVAYVLAAYGTAPRINYR